MNFLDHGIKNKENFYTLLTVMEEFDCDPLKDLARDIRNEIGHEPGTVYMYSI